MTATGDPWEHGGAPHGIDGHACDRDCPEFDPAAPQPARRSAAQRTPPAASSGPAARARCQCGGRSGCAGCGACPAPADAEDLLCGSCRAAKAGSAGRHCHALERYRDGAPSGLSAVDAALDRIAAGNRLTPAELSAAMHELRQQAGVPGGDLTAILRDGRKTALTETLRRVLRPPAGEAG